MSLRVFHMIFIIASILMSGFVGVFGIRLYISSGSPSALAMGIGFAVTGAILVAYGWKAFEKLKGLA